MAIVHINYLGFLILNLAAKCSRTAGDCIAGSKVTNRAFSDTIVNHTIVGPILLSVTAKNERECEMKCYLAVPDKCYMFNYHPSSKDCELLYKDRAAEYKVEKKTGSTFKTQKCASSVCLPSQRCVALGDQTSMLCVHSETNTLSTPGRVIKANTAPVCIGSKDDTYGTIFAPSDGKIISFKLVHVSGGVSYTNANRKGNWGTLTKEGTPSLIEIHVTDQHNSKITPPSGYPVQTAYGEMTYKVPGYTNMSPYLVLPEISPPLAVTGGKEFRIWFGQDLSNYGDGDNSGTTCAYVYVLFSD